VRPPGLPSLDLHGFAVDPRWAQKLYAAVASHGLYRSTDGARSFELVSREVGGTVMAFALTHDGRILAGDMGQGLLESATGARSWRQVLPTGVIGLAVNAASPERVLATGSAIFLSENGGRTWKKMFEVGAGMGPVAWSPAQPDVAYVVGFDRTLYRSDDGGRSWRSVE
jgi:photosystem II stability/assembly factor-like uncharacterized protein